MTKLKTGVQVHTHKKDRGGQTYWVQDCSHLASHVWLFIDGMDTDVMKDEKRKGHSSMGIELTLKKAKELADELLELVKAAGVYE